VVITGERFISITTLARNLSTPAILVRAQTLFVRQNCHTADYFFEPFYFYGFFRKAGVFKRILHFKMVLFTRNASDVALCASVLPSFFRVYPFYAIYGNSILHPILAIGFLSFPL